MRVEEVLTLMNLRSFVLCLSAIGIPLSLLVLVLPITWGYGGYNFFETNSGAWHIYFVDPAGPAARAGLRVGERVIPNIGDAFVQEDAGSVGTAVQEHIVDSRGRVKAVTFAFVPFSGALGLQQQSNKIVNGLTALGAFIVAIVVLLRARNKSVGTRAASVLFFAGLGALAEGGSLVCGNAWCGEVLRKFAPADASAAAVWASLWMLAIYPPNRTRLRTILFWCGAFPMALAVAGNIVRARGIATGELGTFGHFLYGTAGTFLTLLGPAILLAAIIDAFASARDRDVVPVRWLGGMWLIALGFAAFPGITSVTNTLNVSNHYWDFLGAAYVFFTAFGVVYPVLRHRLVDLNIIISRATIFTVVSLIIVAIFVAAEWAIGKVFERSFGFSREKGGLLPELLTLGLVLVLGLSARSIHAFVEKRLTYAFFRRRLQGLAEIERVAREADAATDAAELMDLGVATVQRAIEPLGVAYYLRRAGRYEYATGTAAETFRPAYRNNDGVPLRLRRWQEPFEAEDDSGEHLHVFFVPMLVRGDLIGFLCCGPKPDRTAYLEDETRALSLLADKTAIASALLRQPASQTAPSLAPLLST